MLAVRALSHRFGARQVLDRIELDLLPSRIQVLMGPNGAGKTTLLRLLAGILPVQVGQIAWEGQPVDDEAARSRMRGQIGLLNESPGLYEPLTVRENLRVFGGLQGMAAADCEARIREQAQRFGISDRLEQRAGELSKGLRQRVALIRALLHRPRLLLLDEPTSGLDPDSMAQFHDWIRSARDAGTSVLLASHDFAEAQALGEHTVVLQCRLVALPAAADNTRLQLRLDDPTQWSIRLQQLGCTVASTGAAPDSVLEVQLPAGLGVPALLSQLVADGARVHSAAALAEGALSRYRRALQQLAAPA